MSESPDIQQQFETWWHEEGSGCDNHCGNDWEEHTRKMCEAAWMNGAYCAQQNLIDEEKKEREKK